MEILPSSRTQNSLYPHCSIDSKRKSLFNGEGNSISWNNFSRIKCRKLVFSSSYNESGSITHPGPQNTPLSMNLELISSESQFNQVVSEAQQLDQPLIVLWFDFFFFFNSSYFRFNVYLFCYSFLINSYAGKVICSVRNCIFYSLFIAILAGLFFRFNGFVTQGVFFVCCLFLFVCIEQCSVR